MSDCDRIKKMIINDNSCTMCSFRGIPCVHFTPHKKTGGTLVDVKSLLMGKLHIRPIQSIKMDILSEDVSWKLGLSSKTES